MTVSPDFLSGSPLEILTDKNRMLDVLSAGKNSDESKQMLIEKLNILTRTRYHFVEENKPSEVRLLDRADISDTNNGKVIKPDFSNEFVAGFISCYDLINNSKDLTYVELDKRINEIIDRVFIEIETLKADKNRVGGEKDSMKAFWDLLTSTHKHFQGRIAPRPMGPRKY